MRRVVRISFPLFGIAATSWGQTSAPNPSPSSDSSPADTTDLYEAGKQLFDQYAPPDVKAQYEFPSKEQFAAFLPRLQKALESGSLSDLAAYEPQARAALLVLRQAPEYADMADWLAARIEEIDEAGKIAHESPATKGRPAPSSQANRSAAAGSAAGIPYYDQWLRRVQGRPVPANAAELMPRLRSAFAAEGVPPEVAWLAEAESCLNPLARSPSGARGLFQLKAEAAHGQGLSTFLPDERTDPEKSGRAAAKILRRLNEKFGSWPLAFAAYNAGEGRVGRLLASRRAHDFAGVAQGLPAETRMYVPEVCALIAVRTGLTPDKIQAPK